MKKKKKLTLLEEKTLLETEDIDWEPLDPYDDPNYFITRAFESDEDHHARFRSGCIYNDEYLKKCRDYALKIDKEDQFGRGWMLQELKRCIPFHERRYVFEGISMPEERIN
jgi:hypothetical protein